MRVRKNVRMNEDFINKVKPVTLNLKKAVETTDSTDQHGYLIPYDFMANRLTID